MRYRGHEIRETVNYPGWYTVEGNPNSMYKYNDAAKRINLMAARLKIEVEVIEKERAGEL